MMLARLVIALALVACNKSQGPPPPPKSGDSVPVIPDTILSQLGSAADLIIAVDLGHMDAKPLLSRIPDDVKCVREVLGSIGVAVVALGKDTTTGFTTGATEAATTACVKEITGALGIATQPIANGFELQVPDRPIVATWRDGMATIVQRGHDVPKGKPDPELMTLLAKAPRDAKGVIVQHGEPKKVIKTLAGWLETREQKFIITIVLEGFQPGDAHKTAAEIVAGGKQGTLMKDITLDDRWFEIRDAGLTSTLIATIPYDLGLK